MRNQVLQYDHEQAEVLAELGDRLRQLRQQQGITLEQVAAKTMIPMRTLTAIEQGKLEQLPEPVYIQGFIRRYADVIGINGAEFSVAFPLRPNRLSTRAPWWRRSVRAQLRPLHLYLFYMVLVAAAVSGLSHLMSRSTAAIANLTDPTTQIQPLSTKAPALQLGPANLGRPMTNRVNGPQSKLLVPGKPVRVGLTLTDQSWVRIVADGKTEFEGVLPEGTQRIWVASKEVIVRAGNAGSVLVSYNDSQAKPLGEPGTVEEMTFGTQSPAASASTQATLTASRSGL